MLELDICPLFLFVFFFFWSIVFVTSSLYCHIISCSLCPVNLTVKLHFIILNYGLMKKQVNICRNPNLSEFIVILMV